jgi:hypothetical protein
MQPILVGVVVVSLAFATWAPRRTENPKVRAGLRAGGISYALLAVNGLLARGGWLGGAPFEAIDTVAALLPVELFGLWLVERLVAALGGLRGTDDKAATA